MPERAYTLNLTGVSGKIAVESVSGSYDLTTGYPTIDVSLVGEDVSNLVNAYRNGSLLSQRYSFSITVSGRAMCSFSNMRILKLTPTEAVSGYSASALLAPNAAIVASLFPAYAVFSSANFSLPGAFAQLVSTFNSSFGLNLRLRYTAPDVPCLTPMRFTDMTYMDMFQTLAQRQGLHALIDWRGDLRVFSLLRRPGSHRRIGKQQIQESSLVLDVIQNLV